MAFGWEYDAKGYVVNFDKHRGIFGNYFLYNIFFQKPLGANQNTEKENEEEEKRQRQREERKIDR